MKKIICLVIFLCVNIYGATTPISVYTPQHANWVAIGPDTGADALMTVRALTVNDIGAAALGSGTNDATTVLKGNRTWGSITDASVDAAAAIAGTKIAPAFGAQGVTAYGFQIPQGGTANFSGFQTTNNFARTIFTAFGSTSNHALDMGVNSSNGGIIQIANSVPAYTISLTGSTGVVSATSFTGSGSGLTSVPISTAISGLGTGVATALGVNTGSAGAFVVFNNALGTPSSGTLTSCTGLPIAGLTASTSTALGVGSIELGHATDTTIARSGAGAITVEGVQVILSGAALGTPSSGNGSNLTALNATQLTSGTIPVARFPANTICQIVYIRRDYTGDISTTAGSGAAVAVTSGGNALQQTIVPRASGSLIRIRVVGGNALLYPDSNARLVTILKRNINGGGDTDLTPGGMSGVESLKDQFGSQMPHNIEFIDSPSTALSTVYKVFFYSADGATTVYWNYGTGAAVPVTLTLEEIAQ